MKRVYRIVAALLLLCAAGLSLIGCSDLSNEPGSTPRPVDPNKTQLYIGNFQGGIGDVWLNKVIERFEAENDDIQVWIDPEKDLYADKMLFDRIATNRQDLYFLAGISYQNYIKNNKIADITDVVTTPLNESPYIDSEETTSIAGKFKHKEQTDYYGMKEEKYYAIPFYDCYFGLVYDVDLFEQKKLYFNPSGGFINDLSEPRSAGPDGDLTTEYDNGLPATYSQFKTLLDRMVNVAGVTPMTWTGKYANYFERYLMSIWADYEGAKNFNLNNTFSGEYTFRGDSSPTPINNRNAYLLQKQSGKEYALQYAYDIAHNSDYYSSNAIQPSQSHTMAQDEFLVSIDTNKRIAMLVDAAWWENEANQIFLDMAASNKEMARGVRRFAFMPVPKADDGSSSPDTTLLSASGHSLICINQASTKKDAAKRFLAFCHTEESLREFTRITGVPRPYVYGLEQDDLDSLSHFSRSVWELFTSERTTTVFNTLPTAAPRIEQPKYFANWSWGAYVGTPYSIPVLAFRDNPSMTVKDYCQGMLDMYADWDSKFGNA